MNVLVTGGAGYIGSHAVRELTRSGHEVFTLDNLVYGHREFVPSERLTIGEVGNSDLLSRIFTDHKIEAVMHFAAYAYVGESVTDPAKYYNNNVGSTLSLLDAVRRFGIRYFVFSSTCATYGEPQSMPLDEYHPQNPINPYGRTKLMVEKIIADYGNAYGLKSVCLRYFNAAGADPEGGIGEDHDPETHLIPLILDAALKRRPSITVFGYDYPTKDGTCIRDYIHVTDLARAHVLALDYLVRNGASDAFNLGNGRGFSVQEVINTAGRVTGLPIPVKRGEKRAGDPAVLIGSSAKAISTLGWKPEFDSLEAILDTAWRWHQQRFEK